MGKGRGGAVVVWIPAYVYYSTITKIFKKCNSWKYF